MFLDKQLYRPIIKNAWQITWRNKFLWIFGFFATFLGSGGVYDVVIKGWNTIISRTIFKSFLNFAAPPVQLFENTSEDIIGKLSLSGFIAGIVLALLVVAALYILAVVSQGGIMNAAANIAKRKKADFWASARASYERFFAIFGTNIVAKAIIFCLLFAAGLPVLLLIEKNLLLGNLLYFIAFIISIPLVLVILFIMLYAVAGFTAKDLSFVESIKESFRILKKNWLISLEMALILLLLSILLGFVLTFVMLIVSAPFLILGITAYLLLGETGIVIIVSVAFALFLAIVVLAGSIFTTFQLTAWTLLYLKLSSEGAVSKIIRILTNLPNHIAKIRGK